MHVFFLQIVLQVSLDSVFPSVFDTDLLNSCNTIFLSNIIRLINCIESLLEKTLSYN